MELRTPFRSETRTLALAALLASLGLVAITACGSDDSDSSGGGGSSGTGGTGVSGTGGVGGTGGGSGTPGVIGFDGISAFEALSSAQQEEIKNVPVFFIHMSVGDYMLEGGKKIGFDFGYADSGGFYDSNKLGALPFSGMGVGNHDALGKINAFASMLTSKVGDRVSLAGFKFCYSDIEDGVNVSEVKDRYAQQMANLKSQYPGVRFFHVTTPVEGNDDWALKMNVMRMDFAGWLRQTYGSTDIVFDLQDIESRRADGSVCQSGGTLYLCEENDWSDDPGHPNPETQVRLAKAFLYTLHTTAQ